jgi:uncharacterized protein (DUF2249 family)/hemerythrin-like domain-containing protein
MMINTENAGVEELTRILQGIRAGGMPDEGERAAMTRRMRELPKLHPVSTLSEEHRFILGSLRELAALVERIGGYASFAEMGGDIDVLKGIAHHLVDAESHHQREEDVLFPRMEAHGITLPSQTMRKDHELFRARKRRLYQMAQSAGGVGHGGLDFSVFKGEVREIGNFLARELTDHIFQEDTIVYQIALEVLSADQWADVKRGCDAIGYCCFKPEDQAGAAVELDLREVPLIRRLDTVLSTWKELAPGQEMRITNDKEPRPLRTLFHTAEHGRFEWRYETEGPREWVACIRKITEEQRRTI